MAVKTRSVTLKFDMKNPGQRDLYERFAEVAKNTQTPLERLFRAAAVRGSAETFEKAREKYQRVMDAGDAFDNFEGLNNPATEEAPGSTTEEESGTEPQGGEDPVGDPEGQGVGNEGEKVPERAEDPAPVPDGFGEPGGATVSVPELKPMGANKPGTCQGDGCGKVISKGDRIYWQADGRKAFCEPCGERLKAA